MSSLTRNKKGQNRLLCQQFSAFLTTSWLAKVSRKIFQYKYRKTRNLKKILVHVWPTLVQLNVCREFCTIFWTYLLKMCKKPIQIDGLDSCLGEECADARFGTYLTYSKQDTCYFIVLLSLLILILKIRIEDTIKTYFCYRHTLL